MQAAEPEDQSVVGEGEWVGSADRVRFAVAGLQTAVSVRHRQQPTTRVLRVVRQEVMRYERMICGWTSAVVLRNNRSSKAVQTPLRRVAFGHAFPSTPRFDPNHFTNSTNNNVKTSGCRSMQASSLLHACRTAECTEHERKKTRQTFSTSDEKVCFFAHI